MDVYRDLLILTASFLIQFVSAMLDMQDQIQITSVNGVKQVNILNTKIIVWTVLQGLQLCQKDNTEKCHVSATKDLLVAA